MNKNDLGAPRTLHIIAHAKVYDVVEGWNEMDDQPEHFQFEDHAFNFDYLLHVSGINYLIHPEDIDQIIWLIKTADLKLSNYHFRLMNRVGEIKLIHGLGRLVLNSAMHEIKTY
jgi:hypothetical protein